MNIGVDPIEHKLNCKFLGILIDNIEIELDHWRTMLGIK